MEDSRIVVEGDWVPEQNRTVKNKLQLYFQSKKKSQGGECRVDTEDGVARAHVHFTSREDRDRVLLKQKHEISVDQKTVTLRLSLNSVSSIQTSTAKVSDPQTQTKVKPEKHEADQEQPDLEPCGSCSVALGPVPEKTPRDLLCVLVENVSGLEESGFELELIWEKQTAVVTFADPEDADRFLTLSDSNKKLQQRGLSARLLEPATSVRVESLPPTASNDMLDLYFEKKWTRPDDIVVIPEEQAAVLTFTDPKVVKDICSNTDLLISSCPVKVYPYFDSLGTALFGKDRPEFKIPESFIENLHLAVWKYLRSKNLSEDVNRQMQPYFCRVDLEKPNVKLSPLPSLLRQKNLTVDQVEGWSSTVLKAFREQMNKYCAFDCPVNSEAWKIVEKDVRSIVKDDVELILDLPKGILTVAGQIENIKRLRAPVESMVLKAVNQIDREMNAVEETVSLTPAMFYILNHNGLQNKAKDISPDIKLGFNNGILTIAGLLGEVFKLKNWILEKQMALEKKPLDIPNSLQDFLQKADLLQLSQDLFTSQGICAFFSVESKGLVLVGGSERFLSEAEQKMQSVLAVQALQIDDQEVMKLKRWSELIEKLLDTYNTSNKETVHVQIQQRQVNVVGFENPVKEVSQSLREFIRNHTRVRDVVRVDSCAVVQFIEKKKNEEWARIIKENEISAEFDLEKPKFVISGARVHVQKAKSSFQQLLTAFITDTLVVEKPGAKKYFMTQGAVFLSSIMTEFSCAVILRRENQDDEEFEELSDVEAGLCDVKVKTKSGVEVYVRKADICKLNVGAVVNAANDRLQHIGGLALALLNAAGPELQRDCDSFIRRTGNLRPGETFVTESYRLPCKNVIHAVGPRFSDSDPKTAVALLKRVVKESLREAEKLRCSSVALPAISSGIFGFPVELCAQTITEAVREHCDDPSSADTPLKQVQLVDNNDRTVRLLASAVNKEFSDLHPKTAMTEEGSLYGAGAVGGSSFGRGSEEQSFFEDIDKERESGFQTRASNRGSHSGQPQPGPRGGSSSGRGSEEQPLHDEVKRFQTPAPTRGSPTGRTQPGPRGQRLEQTTAEGLSISLVKGNIQDQTTDVIVNTISETMQLDQGAVSRALLQAAGPGLQAAVDSAAPRSLLLCGEVVTTDGFNLRCQKVFHSVCPPWDNGAGQAEEVLVSIVQFCLEKAEKLQMCSVSFPAIGTGILSFPRALVCRVLLREVHSFSRKRRPRHLRAVAVVVHPSDTQTIDCFTKEFKGQTSQSNVQPEPAFNRPSVRPSSQSQQQPSSPAAASFSQVSSPTLGVYRMQISHVTLEVSSGDITKETCDVIINSSNLNFTLKTGVSKAILDSAGPGVEQECSDIVNSKGFKPRPMIITSGGQLPSRHIIHIVGQKDPAAIKDIVYSVLKVCEENKLGSVAFPALGTGAGGANPALVADAMVEAVEDFVKKKQHKFVRSIKILIFQTAMIKEFHRNMTSREGQPLEKGFVDKVKDIFSPLTSWLGLSSDSPVKDGPVLEGHEFEPTVFMLCAENKRAIAQAKRRIEELIVSEQAKRTISDPVLLHITQADVEKLQELQRNLMVSIRLDRTSEEEPAIHLEGLTRDVSTAESDVRDIIRKVERAENLKKNAFLLSGMVEWQYVTRSGDVAQFDIITNYYLEEGCVQKKKVKITINNKVFTADPWRMKAVSEGQKEVELVRMELKDDVSVPSEWSDMKGEVVKRFEVKSGSKEYIKVETEFNRTGLNRNIVSIERVQNGALWKSYQLMKKQMEMKNKHQNNEKLLFHGTGPDSIDLIDKRGFNRSYAGAHGAMYGNGTYFAVDPSYSARGYSQPDAKGHKRMYLACVLVGDHTTGQSGMITPPAKNSASDLYDSVTDPNLSMFVIFNDIQAYPQYLITFT